MSNAVANSIVIIAIALSACYSVWRLGPRRMRDFLRMRMRKALPGVFNSDVASSGGCDACDGCASTPSKSAPAKEQPVLWRKKPGG